TGKTGETLMTEEGAVFRYLRDSERKYLSIFGEIAIVRAHYTREGHAGLFPLDARLNLPERKYSYVLQDWMASKAVETSYERAAGWVNKRLDLELAHRPIQRVTRDCTEAVEEFMDSLPAPRAETEGPILVHSVDCKGIRMRPEERDPDVEKTEDKPGEKRMACAAQTYSIHAHYRSNEGIADSFFGPSGPKRVREKDPRRPKPLNRRTFVSLKEKKSEVFRGSSRLAKARIDAGAPEKLALMDGEKALWNLSGQFLPGWSEALDLTHAVEKLRIAGRLHYGDGPAAEEYGREATLLLLEGRVGEVIEDLETALEDGTLSGSKAKELKSKALGYFRNNRDRMAYDEHLAKGFPIASGVIESACNSLINIRMEGAGMFWSTDGAEAILKLRGVFLDDLWDEFWAFRTKRERKRLYTKYDNIRTPGQKREQNRKAA
ncbi:MAG: ISKra4 family transposase, partial [Acidobacteriota bacterium]